MIVISVVFLMCLIAYVVRKKKLCFRAEQNGPPQMLDRQHPKKNAEPIERLKGGRPASLHLTLKQVSLGKGESFPNFDFIPIYELQIHKLPAWHTARVMQCNTCTES
jgi:hypothetical protein